MQFQRLLAVVLVAVWSEGISAQDVEMLGRRHGTRPPAAYYEELARNPGAFRFTRGRAARMGNVGALGLSGAGARSPDGATPLRALGPREGPVVGNVLIPVLLGRFEESSVPLYGPNAIQTAYFGTQPGTATVSTFYAEVSSDSISLSGHVRPWVQSSMTELQVADGAGALACCGIGDFVKDLLQLQVGVDWAAYDNDGPDGVPNSGDDDGYVDALAVMHPNWGAECDGSQNRIWSHKWALSDASSGHSPYVTSSPAAKGGVILIDDYFVQGVLSCDGSTLNEIGVFTHETGHAFGLPDLYDTRQLLPGHAGAGTWDLMASGTYGCADTSPGRPCHLGAWSKAVLGWATVVTLPPDLDHGTLTLPPVETTGVVYRVDAADGSGDYFLLENRQRTGLYEQFLKAEGLLVWQIDQEAVTARWAQNVVNADSHLGVWLRQADGLNQLGTFGGNRGDAGDPFPGSMGNSEFHAGSAPASSTSLGLPSGLTVLDIGPSGSDDMSFRLLTRFTTLTVETVGTAGGSGLLRVDGASLADPPGNTALSAPFQLRTLEAAAGEPTAPGERRPFQEWADAPAEPRVRTVTTPLDDATYVASYAGTEYELAIEMTGGVDGVEPGVLESVPVSSDLWFPPDEVVEVTALPYAGFRFIGWSGALAGQDNPALVTMATPVQAGADFELIYSVADAALSIVAAEPQAVQLTAENGTEPVAWSIDGGALPGGLSLATNGLLSGAALDLGPFALEVRATDAIGLTATATLALDVAAPTLPLDRLASSFLLSGPALDTFQQGFLDQQGNGNGTYDLGDFRSWVLASPSLPLSAVLSSPETVRTLRLPVRLEGPESLR